MEGSLPPISSNHPHPLLVRRVVIKSSGIASSRCPQSTQMRTGNELPAKSRKCQMQTFRPHRASNRLDGSRSESGKPARHIGAIAFILGSVALAERRLLIGNYGDVKKEPDERAVAEEMPVSE